MSPADELRAAATRLEDLAAAAKPGPWQQNVDDHGPRKGVSHSVWSDAASDQGIYGYVVEYLDPHDTDAGDTAWIAALGPQVARPLALWLRDQAAITEFVAARQGEEFSLSGSYHALAFARVINGTTS